MKDLSPHITEISKAYEAGAGLLELGLTYRTRSTNIANLLKNAGIPIRHRAVNVGRALTDEAEERLATRYQAGEERGTLLREFSISVRTLYAILRRYKVKPRAPGLRNGLPYWPRIITVSETPAILAYCAGLIDGEGTISWREPEGEKLHGWISISNTNPELMAWLQQHFGGPVYWRKRKGHHLNDLGAPIHYRKPCAVWNVRRTLDIYYLLKALLPFLVVKRHQATTLVEKIKRKYSLP